MFQGQHRVKMSEIKADKQPEAGRDVSVSASRSSQDGFCVTLEQRD